MDDVVTVAWSVEERAVRFVDQTRLPGEERYVSCTTVDQVVDAIDRLVVRGAPALGAAGAYGVAVAVGQARREGWTAAELDAQVARVREARPTAVNLGWGVDRARAQLDRGLDAV